MKENVNKRRIPTSKEWFDYKTNKSASWLYCFMISSATYHNKRLYYTKNSFAEDLPYIKKLLGVTDKRTINKYLNKLIENKYVYEDKEKYFFPNNDEFKGRYYLINKDLLYNLCATQSTISAQLFIYLADRMKYKREELRETTYNFTLKEIKSAFGYSSNSQNERVEKLIKECLQTLKANQFIDYDNIYVNILSNGKNIKVPNYVLTFVCDELPQKITTIKEEENTLQIDYTLF